MKNVKSGFPIVLLLVLLSLALYLVQLYVYCSPPRYVFLCFAGHRVSSVADSSCYSRARKISNREKTDKLKKISMVINAFLVKPVPTC